MLKINNAKYLGVDVGGTKIEACLFDKDYNLISTEKFALPEKSEKNLIFHIKKIIGRKYYKGIKKIGISLKCVVSENKIKHFSLLGGGIDIDLAGDLRKEYEIPVVLENDVNCMALAEYRFGKGKNINNFLLINLGTGLKTSLIYEGKLIRGFTHCAGELGQIGIIVSELQNREIKYRNLICGRGVANIYEKLSGKEKSAEIIFNTCNENEDSRESVEIFTKYFARLLHDLSVYYNPELVVINGSIRDKSFSSF